LRYNENYMTEVSSLNNEIIPSKIKNIGTTQIRFGYTMPKAIEYIQNLNQENALVIALTDQFESDFKLTFPHNHNPQIRDETLILLVNDLKEKEFPITKSRIEINPLGFFAAISKKVTVKNGTWITNIEIRTMQNKEEIEAEIKSITGTQIPENWKIK
jgi:hypothetical protein